MNQPKFQPFQEKNTKICMFVVVSVICCFVQFTNTRIIIALHQ